MGRNSGSPVASMVGGPHGLKYIRIFLCLTHSNGSFLLESNTTLITYEDRKSIVIKEERQTSKEEQLWEVLG